MATNSPVSMDPRIQVEREGEDTVIVLSGQLRGPLAPEVREQVLRALRPHGRLIVDMSRVDEMSSGALRRLLLLARFVRGLGGAVAIRGASESFRDLAEASGFQDLFQRATAAPIPTNWEIPRYQTDAYPTHTVNGFDVRPGKPLPLGATAAQLGVNFSVYSRHATECCLVLYEPGAVEPYAEIPFPHGFRVGDVHAMLVFHLDPEQFEYGFRMDGPFKPLEGHRFDRSRVLLDPAARCIDWRHTWGHGANRLDTPRARLIAEDFDWEDDRPLGLPLAELVIYELHVRGFTRDDSSGVKFPGTYAGMREKIPYFVKLGINCVELLPIFEFDETEINHVNPFTEERLVNYWGYNTLGFYAPKASFAATGRSQLQSDELKTLIKELHRHGIEVILDVVFNHTSEGNESGPTLSFRGLDNATYYMLTPDGSYFDFSGCGNTFNCNHPVVRDYVVSCLRTWVSEYHVDGFRFDLASILGRASDGTPLANPPLLESLALDPILARTKLIAEAWDAGGLYQVGHFPAYGRWAEWNGKFRDCVRKFLKGDMGQVPEMSQRISGSPDMYYCRGPSSSINFVTCHDGFTLADVVSYNEKHNEANGEQNRDGSNENHTWNCGVEGPTTDAAILKLRSRQMKNALTMLFLSQGVPMMLMGDEVGRTQGGNNNAYCQDNETSWFNWELCQANADQLHFCQQLIQFRRLHPALRHPHFVRSHTAEGQTLDLSWHGTRAWQPDWSGVSRVFAFQARLPRSEQPDDVVYAALNMYWDDLTFQPPKLHDDRSWHVAIETANDAPEDIHSPEDLRPLADSEAIAVPGRSIIVLVPR